MMVLSLFYKISDGERTSGMVTGFLSFADFMKRGRRLI
jgi:hypothetical protein